MKLFVILMLVALAACAVPSEPVACLKSRPVLIMPTNGYLGHTPIMRGLCAQRKAATS